MTKKESFNLLYVQVLISILRKVVGESDIELFAKIINEEAKFKEGNVDLPIVRSLAYELIGIAKEALIVLEGDKNEKDKK